MSASFASGVRLTTPPALAPERAVIWPPRTVRTLANGLKVVLVESHTVPKFTAQLVFRSGNAVAAHEAPGLAEITAAVVRTGTESRTISFSAALADTFGLHSPSSTMSNNCEPRTPPAALIFLVANSAP